MRCSLLVPCRNGARYLPRLWATVRAQTRPFDECVVFDDASDDGTSAEAGRLGATVLHSPHRIGAPAARNRLLAAATGDWVHFHDADDTLAPGFLAAMLGRADERADVVLCNVDWLDEASGQTCSEWRYREDDYRERPVASLIQNTVGGIGGLYRRDVLRRIGGFDASLPYWEDTDLHIRLARAGARFAVVDEVLCFAYRRSDSLSNGNLRGVWRAKSDLLARLLDDAPPAARSAVAADAELIARRQVRLGAIADARRSLDVCRRAGGMPPTTRRAALRWLAAHATPTGAFLLQEWTHVLAEQFSWKSS